MISAPSPAAPSSAPSPAAGAIADRTDPKATNGRYLKMNGAGNAILVVDARGKSGPVSPGAVRALGAEAATTFDQLMVIRDPRRAGTDAYLEIFNRDGSEAGACGNGTRCVAWAVTEDTGPPREALTFQSAAGLLPVTRVGATTFTVDMGAPRLRWDEIPLAEPFADTRTIELQVGPIDAPVLHSPSVVSMGNPHAIFWVDDVEAYDLARFGPLLENHPIFPERANISLAQVIDPEHIVLRVWERGAGLTRACGSAACAALVAAARKRLAGRRAAVTLPGGGLGIEWREADGHVLMTGPVEFERAGTLPVPLFAEA